MSPNHFPYSKPPIPRYSPSILTDSSIDVAHRIVLALAIRPLLAKLGQGFVETRRIVVDTTSAPSDVSTRWPSVVMAREEKE